MYVKALFTAPGITTGKQYNVEYSEELSDIWTKKYQILDDFNNMTWCYDDEVEEVLTS